MYNISLEAHNQNGVLNSIDKEPSQPYLRNREAKFQKYISHFGTNLIKVYKLVFTSILQFVTIWCFLKHYFIALVTT